MQTERILQLIARQQAYFKAGETRPLATRLAALANLRKGLITMQTELHRALRDDLGKSMAEAQMSEISLLLSELRFFLRSLGRLAKVRNVPVTLSQMPAQGELYPCPLGNVLIISPWNYPLLLALRPAIAAIAAGNTVILKPSEFAPATARALHRLLARTVPPQLCTLIPGSAEETQFLIDQGFHHIFYTGGAEVGRLVMERAAAQLTPVTLELGGKSPCIVDETANIPLAARRIVFGKLLNCGQTCVAPDYLLVQESVRLPLIAALRSEIERQYGMHPLESPDYGRIVSRRHFDRLCALIDRKKLVYGGQSHVEHLQIAPTILDRVKPSDPIMQEEIFGPLLPILSFMDLEQAVEEIASRPHPLALYLFSEHEPTQNLVTNRLQFGGGCINDTVLQICSPYLPFGGIGGSGMGSYHGKAGFDTFTHYKSVLRKPLFPDNPLRYAPYTKTKRHLLRHLLR